MDAPTREEHSDIVFKLIGPKLGVILMKWWYFEKPAFSLSSGAKEKTELGIRDF